MGNYERFLELDLKSDDYMTSARSTTTSSKKERNLGYKGKCVDPLPAITEEIIRRWKRAADTHESDISLIENRRHDRRLPERLFIEAARILKVKYPQESCLSWSLTCQCGLFRRNETRPNAKRGAPAELVRCAARRHHRSRPTALDYKRKEKIAFSAPIPVENVISAPDIKSFTMCH